MGRCLGVEIRTLATSRFEREGGAEILESIT